MMSGVLGSVVSFIVAISVLVAIHEYGHYIVGKWSGMKILKFSIGFGRPIWSRVAGPDKTEYSLSSIPLGGYVRFLDSREAGIAPEDEGRAFDQRPIPLRIATLLAGPAFNFLFAIFAYWALFIYGIPTLIPSVGQVDESSYAAEAGLQTGDRIVAVDGNPTADWESALLIMLDSMVADGAIPLTLEDADGDRRSAVIDVGSDARRLTEPGLLFDGLGFRPGNSGDRPAVISNFPDGSPAQAAGLLIGDRVVAINGESTDNFADLRRIVTALPGSTVPVAVDRGGEIVTVDVAIGVGEQDGQRFGQLGVVTEVDLSLYYYNRQYGPLDSVGRAMQRTWDSTVFTVTMLGRMVTGDVSIKNISGPVNIAQFAGESAERGLSSFLSFLAIVSISLGVLNLLPIPILDGGQIVYQLVEGIRGAPVSERTQILGQQVGLFALLMLMSFAFYNDLTRLFS
ncbi:MAG: RIP metalloprotease RseP [Pseudomonadota bacterium]